MDREEFFRLKKVQAAKKKRQAESDAQSAAQKAEAGPPAVLNDADEPQSTDLLNQGADEDVIF